MTETISPPWFRRPEQNDVSGRACQNQIPYELRDEMDRDELLSYYETNKQKLENIQIRDGMNQDLANSLKRTLMKSLFHESEWIDIASGLGFNDTSILNELSYHAKNYNSHPFFLLLTKKLSHTNLTWDFFVRVLIEEERFDLLEELHPHINEIITKSSEYNVFNSDSDLCNSALDSGTISIEDNTEVRDDFASIVGSHRVQMEMQTARPDPGGVSVCQPSRTQCLAAYFKNSKVDNEISVFLSHTDDDYDLAVEVAERLRQDGFLVFVQGDQDGVFALDECSIVKKIVKYVDFFVPLVTEPYLRQIDVSNDFENSRLLVRYLFYNFQSQFVDHQCVNRFIKPLVVQNVDKRKVTKHVELRCAMNLWTQFDRFCKLLVDTKRINQMITSNS